MSWSKGEFWDEGLRPGRVILEVAEKGRCVERVALETLGTNVCLRSRTNFILDVCIQPPLFFGVAGKLKGRG